MKEISEMNDEIWRKFCFAMIRDVINKQRSSRKNN